MATEVIMPKMGLTMTEGTLVRWLKKEGDKVKLGDPIFEAQTDKVNLEIEAPATGVLLKILVEEGAVVPVTHVVGYIGKPGEEVAGAPAASPAPAAAAPVAPVAAAPAPEAHPADERIKISPLARRLAKEHDLDVAAIQGTGPGGRIVEKDIQTALAARQAAAAPAAPAPVPAPVAAKPGAPAAALPYQVMQQTPIQKVSAQRMAESFQSAPHFYLHVEVRATRLVELRNLLVADTEQQLGVRLTYTDFLVRALALALPKHPLMNAAFVAGEVRAFQQVNLGIAIDAPNGLVVGVVHGAEKMTLGQLAQARAELARRAADGRLSLDDLSDGTFTLTNLGMFGIDSFSPILNPPQSGILAAGAIAERPVGENGQLALRPTMQLTLAADHRAVDGAAAARFLKELRELLESPTRLLV